MKLAYGRMFQDHLDRQHGLPRAVLDELSGRFAAVQDEVQSRRNLGEYGFYSLGDQNDTVTGIRRFAEGVGQAFDHVLVLGIGGSALGTKALLGAGSFLPPPACTLSLRPESARRPCSRRQTHSSPSRESISAPPPSTSRAAGR